MWSFKHFEGRKAFIDDSGKSLTYGALEVESIKLSNVIKDRCLVFSLCNNSIGSVLGYVSFIQNRIVPVMLNAHLERELLNNLLNVYKPKYVWLPSEKAVDFCGFEKVYTAFDYCLLKTNFSEDFELYGELCVLLTTSGSTGSPKLVRQSYKNVEVNTRQIVEYLKLDENERPITTLPMNYTYGLSIINSHLMVGATILLTDRTLMQRELWKFLKEQEATSFGGVPYTYEMLDKLRFFRMDLPSLKTITQAGGKLSPELHKKFAEYCNSQGKNFIVMYGACEATARMAYLPAEYSISKFGSMGIAIPNGKLYLLDENDRLIDENNVVGELVYEGENVTLGYAECGVDLIKGDERQGVLRTGDMAKRDDDGFYYIVGRKKRFLKIYGNRVNLDEIDRLIRENYPDIDCASSGVDDHLYIFVNDVAIVDGVKSYISSKTGLNLAAFSVCYVDKIPRNDSGKIKYAILDSLIKK